MPHKRRETTARDDAENETDAPDTDATGHASTGDLDAYAKALAERMPAFTEQQRERLALILRQTDPPPTE